jgi:hypothetical protein
MIPRAQNFNGSAGLPGRIRNSLPDVTQEEGARDLIVADVVELKPAGVLVAQQHVAFVAGAEIAEAGHLPIKSDGAQERGAGDLIVVDVVDLQPAGRPFASLSTMQAALVARAFAISADYKVRVGSFAAMQGPDLPAILKP